MRKVNEVQTYRQFWDKLFDDYHELVKAEVKKVFDNLSSYKLFMVSKKPYFIVGVLGLLLIVFVSLFFGIKDFSKNRQSALIVGSIVLVISIAILIWVRKRVIRKTKELFNGAIDTNYLFGYAFNQLHDHIEFLDFSPGFLSELETYRSKGFGYIPDHARILGKSQVLKLKINNSVAYAQTLIWVYETSDNAKYKRRAYTYDGLIKIVLSDEDLKFNEFDFSMFYALLYLQPKIKTENKEFNKRVNLRANDQIKARIFATPFAMEEILKNRENVKSPKYSVEKKGRELYIRFVPHDQEVLVFDYEFTEDFEDLINRMVVDILEDTYQIFALLAFIMIPPFFDFKKIYQDEIEEK